MSLAEPAAKAARMVREAEYVRLLAAPTGDAVAACALLTVGLRRAGIDTHVTFQDDLAAFPAQRVAGESCLFLVDGWLRPEPQLAELAARTAVLSHDEGRGPEGAVVLSAQDGGMDGGLEASAATMAYLIAHAVDKRNADLAFLALAGALADHHRLDAGLHASLAAEAEEAGHLAGRKDLALAGPLAAALAAPDPFLRGVSGRARAARKLCSELRVDPDAEVASLEDAERARVATALALRLLEQGAPPSGVDALTATDVVARGGALAGHAARSIGLALAAAAAAGRSAEALATLLAGFPPAFPPADPLPSLIRAERDSVGIHEAAPGAEGPVARAVAGYLAGGRPALAWSVQGDLVRVAGAAPRETRGDVGSAFRKVAQAHGGAVAAGNRLAARALLPAGARERFVGEVADALEVPR